MIAIYNVVNLFSRKLFIVAATNIGKFLPIITGRQHSYAMQDASPVLATIEMSVGLSVRHTQALSENDASLDHEIFTEVTDRPRIVFGIKKSFRNSIGFTPSEGIK